MPPGLRQPHVAAVAAAGAAAGRRRAVCSAAVAEHRLAFLDEGLDRFLVVVGLVERHQAFGFVVDGREVIDGARFVEVFVVAALG